MKRNIHINTVYSQENASNTLVKTKDSFNSWIFNEPLYMTKLNILSVGFKNDIKMVPFY